MDFPEFFAGRSEHVTYVMLRRYTHKGLRVEMRLHRVRDGLQNRWDGIFLERKWQVMD